MRHLSDTRTFSQATSIESTISYFVVITNSVGNAGYTCVTNTTQENSTESCTIVISLSVMPCTCTIHYYLLLSSFLPFVLPFRSSFLPFFLSFFPSSPKNFTMLDNIVSGVCLGIWSLRAGQHLEKKAVINGN